MSFSSSGTPGAFDHFNGELGSSNSNTTSPSLATDASHAGIGTMDTSAHAATGSALGQLPWPLKTQLSQSPEIVSQPYPLQQQYHTPPQAYGLTQTHTTPITPLSTQPFAEAWPVTPSRGLAPHQLHTSPGQGQGMGMGMGMGLNGHTALTPLVEAWSHGPSPVTPTPGRVPQPQPNVTANYNMGSNAGPATPRKRVSMSAASSPHNMYSPYAYPMPASANAGAGAGATGLNGRPARPRVSLPPMPSSHMSSLSPAGSSARNSVAGGGPGSYFSPVHSLSYAMRMHPAPAGHDWNHYPDGKPPRFKPTKAQLALLVDSYNRNQTPDADERERLRRLLGPDMKAKTIQIWFQNRRSKSRTKERQAAARRAEGGADVESSGSGGDGKSDTAADQAGVAAMEAKRIEVQLEDLRCLVRDVGTLVPIQILAVGAWIRFLTPGQGPADLAMAYTTLSQMTPTSPTSMSSSHIAFYVRHGSASYRISIPLDVIRPTLHVASSITSPDGCMQPRAGTRDQRNVMSFTLPPGVASFSFWRDLGGWSGIDDFSGGAIGIGGRIEITGGQELVDACEVIKRSMSALTTTLPFSRTSFDSSFTHSTHASISSTTSLLGSFSAIEPLVPNPFTRPAISHTTSGPANLFPTLQMQMPVPPTQTPATGHSPPIITPRAAGGSYPFLLPSAMSDDQSFPTVETGRTQGEADIDPFGLTMPSYPLSPEGASEGGAVVHSSPVLWPSDMPLINDPAPLSNSVPGGGEQRVSPTMSQPDTARQFSFLTAGLRSHDVSPPATDVQRDAPSRSSSQDDFTAAFDMAENSLTENWHSYMQGLDSAEWLQASS